MIKSLAVLTATLINFSTSTTNEFLTGVDVSALPKMEQAGAEFFDENGKRIDVIKFLISKGANCFRLRLFVDPNGRNLVVNDINYTLELARRIKEAGANLIIDFHFSDTWADPGKQIIPRRWRNLSFDELKRKLEDYTFSTISVFKSNGIDIYAVQIGNEITSGILWPLGKIGGKGDRNKQWSNFAELLKSAVKGVRKANPKIKIILHIHSGGNWQTTKWFFSNIEKRKVPYDIIGLSYYPWWHGSMKSLRRNLKLTCRRFKKPIIIVETAYPYTSNKYKRWKNKMFTEWKVSPDGQKKFLEELIKTVKRNPCGKGVLWWFPESVQVKGLFIWNAGTTAMFDESGKALPVVDVFGK